VDAAIGVDREGWKRRAGPASGTDANEGDHRRELEKEDSAEERHLRPEEAVAPIEGRLLAAEENPRETRSDPEAGGGAPEVVRGQQTSPAGVVERRRQSPATRDDRAKPERQRQSVNRG